MQRMLRLLGLVLAVAAGVAVVAWAWSRLAGVPAAQAPAGAAVSAAVLERTGTVPDLLAESSGVAVSRRQAGVLWSHNDSGDGAYLYAIDLSGRLLARVEIRGATARDWEDLALAPCPLEPGDCLYVGEIGDNAERYGAYAVYVVPEPVVEPGDEARELLPVRARSVSFRYPTGSHDAEALAVSPAGDIVIVTKGRKGRIQVFTIPRRSVELALQTDETVTAVHVGDLPIVPDERMGRMVTGAALAPAGDVLVVRTYTEIYRFVRAVNGGFEPAGPPCSLLTEQGLAEPQGEAVDVLDDETLVLTSESWQRPGPIHRVRCG